MSRRASRAGRLPGGLQLRRLAAAACLLLLAGGCVLDIAEAEQEPENAAEQAEELVSVGPGAQDGQAAADGRGGRAGRPGGLAPDPLGDKGEPHPDPWKEDGADTGREESKK
ncbi:MAG: hypothetical protein HY744_07955 [Deltaproteobacteria bacterium]|nr:hypothetical protein [Deltaproteobacteria bacterium]